MQHLRRMEDRVVLITGGGIAKGVARAYADEGAKVVLTDLFPEGMSSTKAELERDFGAQVLTLVVDGFKEDQLENTLKKATTHRLLK